MGAARIVAAGRDVATVRALRTLLEGDEEEQSETFAYLKQVLDEDRFSTRRLFP